MSGYRLAHAHDIDSGDIRCRRTLEQPAGIGSRIGFQ